MVRSVDRVMIAYEYGTKANDVSTGTPIPKQEGYTNLFFASCWTNELDLVCMSQ